MDFDTAFNYLIGNEGALSTDRKDRGNWTSGKVGVGEFKGVSMVYQLCLILMKIFLIFL